jgi:hypothetical protein
MRFKTTMLSGTVLSALAGSMLFAASAFAQNQTPSGATPGTAYPSSTAEPGTMAQPDAATQQGTPNTSSQQQMTSPQPMSSPATTSASAGEPLSKVKDAKTTLAAATLKDASGQSIGQVATVHTTKRGTPTTVDVTLQTSGGQSKTVAIKASQLQYDQSSNTLKTDLTSTEVQSLPSATGM